MTTQPRPSEEPTRQDQREWQQPGPPPGYQQQGASGQQYPPQQYDNYPPQQQNQPDWGYQQAPPGSYEQAPAKKKRRIFLWFFLAVQALFIIWIIAGIASASGQPSDCQGLSAKTCNDATDVGTGIGVAVIVILWMVVDFLLAVIYGVYRLARHT
jgi:hypothetical protein